MSVDWGRTGSGWPTVKVTRMTLNRHQGRDKGVHGGNLQRLAERWALMTATIRSEGVPGGKNPRYLPSRSIR